MTAEGYHATPSNWHRGPQPCPKFGTARVLLLIWGGASLLPHRHQLPCLCDIRDHVERFVQSSPLEEH